MNVSPLALAILVALSGASLTPARANDAYDGSGSNKARVDDAYRPPDAGGESYVPDRRRSGGDVPVTGTGRPSDPGGYGQPYEPAIESTTREERYEPAPPGAGEGSGKYYSQGEIVRAGHGFFGSVSEGMASAVEWAFQKAGRPNGYILGEDAGGAVVAGVRYGEGTLNTKDAGTHKVYWQGPSVGYDLGAEGSKVMILVYNMQSPSDIYQRFAGVQGAAYVIGGVGVQIQKAGDVTLAPIRSGVGLRLGANVGYLKYTRAPTWNPF